MPSIEALEALLEKEPDDVFLNFGLSMALAAAGRSEEALERLDRTLELDSGYVAAFFQKGRLLADLGRTGEATQTLREGVEAARAAGDAHAREKMEELLSQIV